MITQYPMCGSFVFYLVKNRGHGYTLYPWYIDGTHVFRTGTPRNRGVGVPPCTYTYVLVYRGSRRIYRYSIPWGPGGRGTVPYGGRARGPWYTRRYGGPGRPAPLFHGDGGPGGRVRACNCGFLAQICNAGLLSSDLMVGPPQESVCGYSAQI